MKHLYKAIEKCQIKIPRRAPDQGVRVLTVWARWEWMILAV